MGKFNLIESGFIGQLKAEQTKLLAEPQIASDMMSVGMLRGQTAKATIERAKGEPDPEPLWMEFWYEGEVCCLFADSNLGKSIYATQIANAISQKKKVLYYDFELSDKQFQLRYTAEDGTLHDFNDNLIRVCIDPDRLELNGDFEEVLISNIEQFALAEQADIHIIDNLTYLCNASEKGDAAGNLMMRLMQLKKKYGWSILILAHTPKRNLTNPITQNDLAGSKKLYNFFDSVFAIGKSAVDENQRYIKQIKVRFGGYKYDGENVIVANIEKIGAMLQFVNIGYAAERDHLKEQSAKDRSQFISDVMALRNQGLTIEKIAAKLGKSKSAIGRIVRPKE